MKSLQHLCAAVTLTLTFALPVFAGEISTGPGIAPPPPPPPSMVVGEMDTPRSTEEGAGEAAAVNPFAEIGLSLLQSVLSLF